MGKKFILILTAVAALVVLLFIVLNPGNSEEESVLEETSQDTEPQVFENSPDIDGQPTEGDNDAPVTIVEFGDFMCPACSAWGEEYYPQLKGDFIDTGDVQFAYVNTLFHGEQSEKAALAAESVFNQAPEAYWDFHHALFEAQESDNHHSEWVTDELITELVDTHTSLDASDVLEDIENQSFQDELNIDEALNVEFGIQLTPTILINNRMIEDPFDYDEIRTVINEELEES